MEKSAMTVIRFVICAGILFVGFGIAAWAILGPYHLKFESVFSTFQCLMAMLNGDEIYITMTAIEKQHAIAWWFNMVFNTVFIVIYTLIALNIFIAIFNTSYEHLRNVAERRKEKSEQTPLETFLGRQSGEPLFRLRKEKCPCFK